MSEWADYWYTDCDCGCHDGSAVHTGPCRCFLLRDAGMPCQNCRVPFDTIRYRWVCPWCHTKNTCCE